MAGDWIKVEHVTPDKPEVHRMAELLGIDPDAVVGKLVRVWIWADQQTTDGHAPSVTRALLDRLTAVTGFADAMAHDTVRWLVRDDTGEVSFPHFDRHNGASAKARSQAAKRQHAHREASRSCHAPTVTSALPEKRREEKSINTPNPPRGDGVPEVIEDKTPEDTAQTASELPESWSKLVDPGKIVAYVRKLTTAEPSSAQLACWKAAMVELHRRNADPEAIGRALNAFLDADPKFRGAVPDARRIKAEWFLGLVTKYGTGTRELKF